MKIICGEIAHIYCNSSKGFLKFRTFCYIKLFSNHNNLIVKSTVTIVFTDNICNYHRFSVRIMKSKIMLKRDLDGDSMNNNVVKNPNKMKSF